MELDKAEAKQIAKGIKAVSAHYNIPGLDIKDGPGAIVSLAFVLAFIYGKRAIAWSARGRGGKTPGLSPGASKAPDVPAAAPSDIPVPQPWFMPTTDATQ